MHYGFRDQRSFIRIYIRKIAVFHEEVRIIDLIRAVTEHILIYPGQHSSIECIRILHESQADLPLISHALDRRCFIPSFIQSRQKKPREDGDDGDNDE